MAKSGELGGQVSGLSCIDGPGALFEEAQGRDGENMCYPFVPVLECSFSAFHVVSFK